jgi:hypothetical protein
MRFNAAKVTDFGFTDCFVYECLGLLSGLTSHVDLHWQPVRRGGSHFFAVDY